MIAWVSAACYVDLASSWPIEVTPLHPLVSLSSPTSISCGIAHRSPVVIEGRLGWLDYLFLRLTSLCGGHAWRLLGAARQLGATQSPLPRHLCVPGCRRRFIIRRTPITSSASFHFRSLRPLLSYLKFYSFCLGSSSALDSRQGRGSLLSWRGYGCTQPTQPT